MRRLTHLPEAYLRAMQMSQNQVFLFVEGRNPDPYFYGKVFRTVIDESKYRLQICRAEEVGSSGGKETLVRFFVFLTSRSARGGEFKGKKWFSLFYIDKDIDDILNNQIRSPHIVYTEFFDVENHIYAAGDLREAAAVSTGVDVSETPNVLSNSDEWRRAAAELWKPWVTLCLLVSKLEVSCACGFRRKSQINIPAHAPATQGSENPYLQDIRDRSGLSAEAFAEQVSAANDTVGSLYGAGEFDKVFKGKWYASILCGQLLSHLEGRPALRDSLEIRLTQAVAQTLKFDENWVRHFSEPLESLANKFLN